MTAFRCSRLNSRITASVATLIVAQTASLADEDSFRDCFNQRKAAITENIIKQCQVDMARIIANTGRINDALASEEHTCEETAATNAMKIAVNECKALLEQPPLKR